MQIVLDSYQELFEILLRINTTRFWFLILKYSIKYNMRIFYSRSLYGFKISRENWFNYPIDIAVLVL